MLPICNFHDNKYDYPSVSIETQVKVCLPLAWKGPLKKKKKKTSWKSWLVQGCSLQFMESTEIRDDYLTLWQMEPGCLYHQREEKWNVSEQRSQ